MSHYNTSTLRKATPLHLNYTKLYSARAKYTLTSLKHYLTLMYIHIRIPNSTTTLLYTNIHQHYRAQLEHTITLRYATKQNSTRYHIHTKLHHTILTHIHFSIHQPTWLHSNQTGPKITRHSQYIAQLNQNSPYSTITSTQLHRAIFHLTFTQRQSTLCKLTVTKRDKTGIDTTLTQLYVT